MVITMLHRYPGGTAPIGLLHLYDDEVMELAAQLVCKHYDLDCREEVQLAIRRAVASIRNDEKTDAMVRSIMMGGAIIRPIDHLLEGMPEIPEWFWEAVS